MLLYPPGNHVDGHRRPAPKDALSDERLREIVVAEVLMDTEQRAIERRTRDPGRTTTRGRIATAVVLSVVAIWMWVLPPSFLSVQEAPPPSYERVEAGLRLAMALHADKVEQFRTENGRLPDELREIGDAYPGLYYRRMNANVFRIHGVEGETRILYEAGDSMSVIVRNALTVLREER